MKKQIIAVAIAFLMILAPAHIIKAQGVVATAGAPTGGCSTGLTIGIDVATGQLYPCVAAAFSTLVVGGQPKPVASGTAVTSSNPTINTDQNLIQLSLPAGFLNTLAAPFDIYGSGIYSSTTASLPALTIKAKLCTISGCGSGTVVTLFNIVTPVLNTVALTNATWNLKGMCITTAIGATGNLACHGSPGLVLDVGAALTTPDSVYPDTNTATLANIDLTAALFLQFTVAQSVVGGSNSYTQQLAAIR